MPGRKTDVRDAEWIASLLQHGLFNPSFVPSQQQQDLRDLTRLRISLVRERTRQVNRVRYPCSCEAGMNVLSDIMGLSGRAILQALIEGESDPERLASLMHPACARESGAGGCGSCPAEVREHHRFAAPKSCSRLLSTHERSIRHLEEKIEQHLQPFEKQIERCEKINGVSRHLLHVLMAEVGTDLDRFPEASHLSRFRWRLPRAQGKRREATEWQMEERKAIGMCERCWYKRLMGCAAPAQNAGGALSTKDQNVEEVNEQQ